MLLKDIEGNITGEPVVSSDDIQQNFNKITEILNRKKDLLFTAEWELEWKNRRGKSMTLRDCLCGRYRWRRGFKEMQFKTDGSISPRNGGHMQELCVQYCDYKSFPKVHAKFIQAEEQLMYFKNETCGFHLHIDTKKFPMLKRIEYAVFFGKEITNLCEVDTELANEVNERLSGQGSRGSCWCSPKYRIDPFEIRNQHTRFQGDGRYQMINFQAIQKYGTVENRLFSTAKSYNDLLKKILIILRITEKYIDSFNGDTDKNIFDFGGRFSTIKAKKYIDADLGEIYRGGGVSNQEETVAGEKFYVDSVNNNISKNVDLLRFKYNKEMSAVTSMSEKRREAEPDEDNEE